MLKPTQDKEAITAVATILSPVLFYGVKIEDMKGKVGEYTLDKVTKKILIALDELGYHKGLPLRKVSKKIG